MQCFIYRSARKEGLYIYLAKADNFECLPENLLKQASPLELAMELELTTDKKLRREDAAIVMNNIADRGYHVQMPDRIESLLDMLKQQK